MSKGTFETWPYEEQTKIKHQVFADYFDKWVKIVGKYHNLNYIDGFGGCGAYDDKGKIMYGSPILAAQISRNNHRDLKRNVRFVIIDKNSDNIKNIQAILDHLGIDIKPTFINDDFDRAVNKILDSVKSLAPTFFFIDPFGFKIKMSTLQRIMEHPHTEILLNFMYNAINRFLSLDLVEETLNELFGCEGWKKFCDTKGSCREQSLVELYRYKLKEFTRFVCYYRISFPTKKRTYYYLFHLTNHIKGCSLMKSCFAKYAKGRVEYLGKYGNQRFLDEFGNAKEEDIKRIVLSVIGNPLTYQDLLGLLIDEIIYLESSIYKVLKSMESDGQIVIHRDPEFTPTGRKRRSIEHQDIIVLKEVDDEKNNTKKSSLSERG